MARMTCPGSGVSKGDMDKTERFEEACRNDPRAVGRTAPHPLWGRVACTECDNVAFRKPDGTLRSHKVYRVGEGWQVKPWL